MFRVTLDNLLAHRRRLLSTFLAVVLGIAFLSGTIVLGDTIKGAFNHLLATVNSGTDAYVRRVAVTSGGEEGAFGGGQRGALDDSVIATVKAVPGVAAAEGDISAGGVQILDRTGSVIGGGGPGGRARGGSWKADARLNAFQLVSGQAPSGPGDVVIDRASAKSAGYHEGDTVTILTPDRHQFTVVGVAKFGTEDSPGGGSYALFTLPESESLFTAPGKVDAVVARATTGVSQETLVKRIEPVVPQGTEVLTGAAIVKETQDSFQQRIGTFTTVLSSFAFVAVIVGGFVIYNTFSILVAQRSRETALLRALGATRAQVLRAQLLESLMVALIASSIGVVAGVGVGALLRELFRAGGFPFPPGGIVFHASAAVIGLTVGILITMFAAVMPAVRASRVAPVAALRESAIDTSHTSRARLTIGTVITVLGVLLVLIGVVAKRAAAPIGFGAALSLIGTVVLGPVVARPMAAVVGSLPARLRGVAGLLARQNAMRNPRRTAGTAAALMVGVAVVAFFTVLGASLQATTTDQISRSFVGDLAIATKGFGGGGLSPQLSKQVNDLPEVAVAAPIRGTEVELNGDNQFLLATDPAALVRVLSLDVLSGSFTSLGTNKLAVSDTKAKSTGVKVGDGVDVVFPETGPQRFTVGAIFRKNDVLSSYVISTAADDANELRPRDQQVFVKFRSDVPFARGRSAVEAVAAPYPNATVQDEHDLKQSYVQQINSFLAVIFGMLALAIIIALMGISNTLQLSVYERTRELGLLRSVGSLRSQVRSMVRWEAVIIALFGTIGGLLLGVAFGWAIVHGLGRDQNILFAVPVGRVIVIMVVGAVAGVLAALRPASRASRLNILQAIATE